MDVSQEMVQSIEDMVKKNPLFSTNDAVLFLTDKYSVTEVEALIIIEKWLETEFS